MARRAAPFGLSDEAEQEIRERVIREYEEQFEEWKTSHLAKCVDDSPELQNALSKIEADKNERQRVRQEAEATRKTIADLERENREAQTTLNDSKARRDDFTKRTVDRLKQAMLQPLQEEVDTLRRQIEEAERQPEPAADSEADEAELAENERRLQESERKVHEMDETHRTRLGKFQAEIDEMGGLLVQEIQKANEIRQRRGLPLFRVPTSDDLARLLSPEGRTALAGITKQLEEFYEALLA
jgi:predicted transcriptional regulator